MGAGKSNHVRNTGNLTVEEEKRRAQIMSHIVEQMIAGKKDYGNTTVFARDGVKLCADKYILQEFYPEDRFFRIGNNEYAVMDKGRKGKLLAELLRYRYLRRVENLPDVARDLLIEAHRYKLRELKELCADTLAENLTLDNAVETYVFSRACGCKKLKSRARSFILANLMKLIDSSKLAKLKIHHPDAWQELTRWRNSWSG